MSTSVCIALSDNALSFSFRQQKQSSSVCYSCANNSSVSTKQTQHYKDEASQHTGAGLLIKVCKVIEGGRQKTFRKKREYLSTDPGREKRSWHWILTSISEWFATDFNIFFKRGSGI